MVTEHFDEEDFVKRYVERGPSRFVPGFESLHRMADLLLAETVPDNGSVLIIGAGGGHELTRLATGHKGWRFCAVDPSEEMLKAARYRMADQGDNERVDWIQGVVDDAPDGPFDAATCLLTLHFVPDDGAKLETLRSIRSRLTPGAPFVLADLCMDQTADDFDVALGRYARFAGASGADPDDVRQAESHIREGHLNMATPERNAALFAEAGFSRIGLFYAGFSWRGWSMHA
ncbi:methyltransferase [Parasphingopyxis sp.]|uniref:class I SAM-dependent methyltransferase n=1 Tax=Parasphingopyxis sp. TaxID=1920299 RepID=UPI00262C4C62|nr:methyltransferase [Parasphingopyxis sp.]